jgi:predicted nucleic acid-binding Zn ribbon protein
VKRLIGTGSGVIFKGSGFYQTDYRSESYKKAEKKEKEGVAAKKTPAESKDKTSGKSKPDAKAKKESA